MDTALLKDSNIIYRRPEFAERARRASAERHTDRWLALINQHHPEAHSVLDLGCGTGMDAEELAHRYRVTGVDIQPHLIDHARIHRPGIRFVCGDITSIRLGEIFSVILCVGHTLSYVSDSLALDAAFATFSAHADTGTVLIVQTLLAPTPRDEPPHRLDVDDFHATWTDFTSWQPLTQLLTTKRVWQHHDGHTEIDDLRRRVLPPTEMELRARIAGWQILDIDFDSSEQAGTTGSGCVIARFSPKTRTHSDLP